jgi:tetratricopeptide (TPR) repeat protein
MSRFIAMAAGLALACGACAAHQVPGVAEMQALSSGAGWNEYRTADALVEEGRTDEAVGEYRRAQALFDDRNEAGRAMAVYARARAFDLAGRCGEAVATYHEYADMVRRGEPASADAALSVASDCRQWPSGEPGLTRAVRALGVGDYASALAILERVEPATPLASGWREYDRGEALTALRRTTEALLAFDRAEAHFAEAGDERGRADAVWGKARALEQAGRCPEAGRAYASYERLVRTTDPRAAQLAESNARACGVPGSVR